MEEEEEEAVTASLLQTLCLSLKLVCVCECVFVLPSKARTTTTTKVSVCRLVVCVNKCIVYIWLYIGRLMLYCIHKTTQIYVKHYYATLTTLYQYIICKTQKNNGPFSSLPDPPPRLLQPISYCALHNNHNIRVDFYVLMRRSSTTTAKKIKAKLLLSPVLDLIDDL